MRDVKSRGYFEQMIGRGTRVIDSNDFKAVTPDAVAKNTCQSCHEKPKVYFPDGLFLKGGQVYRYLCPGCGEIVYFHPDAGAVIVSDDESIPDDATIAMKKAFH
jgi:hypothetical protein